MNTARLLSQLRNYTTTCKYEPKTRYKFLDALLLVARRVDMISRRDNDDRYTCTLSCFSDISLMRREAPNSIDGYITLRDDSIREDVCTYPIQAHPFYKGYVRVGVSLARNLRNVRARRYYPSWSLSNVR
jgi:hypothetical protein